MKRFILDIIFILTGETCRKRNPAFKTKPTGGQWDGVVIKESLLRNLYTRLRITEIKRRISSVRFRRNATPEMLCNVARKAKFDAKNYGIVALDREG